MYDLAGKASRVDSTTLNSTWQGSEPNPHAADLRIILHPILPPPSNNIHCIRPSSSSDRRSIIYQHHHRPPRLLVIEASAIAANNNLSSYHLNIGIPRGVELQLQPTHTNRSAQQIIIIIIICPIESYPSNSSTKPSAHQSGY
jgi:hypothetical protein